MSKRQVMVVMGTRPEAIKLAPVVRAFQKVPDLFDLRILSTAQHRQMLDQVLSLFELLPDIDLDLMRPNQSLSDLTADLLKALTVQFQEFRPDLVLVQGDTTTALAASLAAFYLTIPVGHVEAGLRTFQLDNPFPEEMNRRFISLVGELHFAPTPLGRSRLVAEGIPAEKIVVTGNTVIDAVCEIIPPLQKGIRTGETSRKILVTSHRRESWGEDLENICLALRDLVEKFANVEIIFPVHLNPNVQCTVTRLLVGVDRIHLCPPLPYADFLRTMQSCYLVLSDSGGVAEEAPALKKPLLLLRKVTERPEGCYAGVSRIIGTDREAIVAETSRLLEDEYAYSMMIGPENPYGDGKASARIVKAIHRWFMQRQPLLSFEEEFQSQRETLCEVAV